MAKKRIRHMYALANKLNLKDVEIRDVSNILAHEILGPSDFY